MYKLRIYKTNGSDKGHFDHEEFFKTLDDMQVRYGELFVYSNYSLNPTAWKKEGQMWKRIAGY